MLSNSDHLDVWNDKTNLQVTQDGLYLKPVITAVDMANSINVRHKVFVEEQGVDFSEEVIIEEEKSAKAYLIFLNTTCIGTIRYRIVNEEYKIERFAILKEYRNKGYGTAVMNYVVNMIGDKFNPCTITLNAQIQVVDFYTTLGFVKEGDIFQEAGISHIRMNKKM